MSKSQSHEFIGTLEGWFNQLPALPKNVKEIIVKIMPYLALLFGGLGILSAIGSLGIISSISPVGYSGYSAYGTGIAAIINLSASAMLLLAYAGTKARTYKGWQLLFWSEVISLIGGIVALTSLVGVVIGAAIGFYLLFQIKSYYK